MSTTTEITIVGMTCGHCVTAVTEEVTALGGITDVAVDLESGRVSITSDGPLSSDAIAAAIAEAGYQLA